MAISDKTRKILWGRSGNRCAVCRIELVIDSTAANDESVVGEECHIVSPREQGPRFEASFPVSGLDEPANLTLLCRIHHKQVDDQKETYTVDLLHSIKQNHERWVASSLGNVEWPPPIRVRRIRENIPTHLVRLTTGRQLFEVLDGAAVFQFDNDDPTTQEEAELLAGFLQDAQDIGDISGEFDAGDRVTTAFRLNSALDDLDAAGFWVFGAREVQRLEGDNGAPVPWTAAILHVRRSDNPDIVAINTVASTDA